MTSPIDERPRGRRRFQVLASVFASTILAAGVTLTVLGASPASAANVAFSQCNGTGGGGGQTVACSVVIINNLTNDPTTTGSIVNGVPSPDLVTSVTQCNGSENGGKGILNCHISITNNIAIDNPAAAGSATINQCQANQPTDGLGNDLVNTCNPSGANTSGATITQCNGTGDGGGLVPASPFSHCTASGTVSASLLVTVNQCNGSANGGDQAVLCSVTMTTNVVNTTAVAVTPATTPSISSLGTVGVTRSGVTRPTAIESSPLTTG